MRLLSVGGVGGYLFSTKITENMSPCVSRYLNAAADKSILSGQQKGFSIGFFSFAYLCYGSTAIINILTLTVRGLTLDVR